MHGHRTDLTPIVDTAREVDIELKTDPIPFTAIWERRKLCEIRKEDRIRFEFGMRLRLRETTDDRAEYTGREMHAFVTHVQRGYGLPSDVAVLSIVIWSYTNPPHSGAQEG